MATFDPFAVEDVVENDVNVSNNKTQTTPTELAEELRLKKLIETTHPSVEAVPENLILENEEAVTGEQCSFRTDISNQTTNQGSFTSSMASSYPSDSQKGFNISFKSDFDVQFDDKMDSGSWMEFSTEERKDNDMDKETIESSLQKLFKGWQERSGNNAEKSDKEIKDLVAALKTEYSIEEHIICFKNNNEDAKEEDESQNKSDNEDEVSEGRHESKNAQSNGVNESLSPLETLLMETAKIIIDIIKRNQVKDVQVHVLEWAFMTLSDIFKYRAVPWEKMYGLKPLEHVIAAMQGDDSLTIRSSGCKVIASIIESMPDMEKKNRYLHAIANTGAIEILHSSMKLFERNEKIHANCGNGLCVLSIHHSNTERAVQLDLPQSAIRSMFDHRECSSIAGIDHSLTNWAYHNRNVKEMMWNQNVPALLLQRMHKFPDCAHLQSIGCFFLANTLFECANFPEIRKKREKQLDEGEAFDAIFKALENHVDHRRMNHNAILCIALSCDNAAMRKRYYDRVIESGGVDAVLKSMAFHENDRGIQSVGSMAIYSLAAKKEGKTQLKQRGAIEVLEKARKKFPVSESLQHNVGLAMFRLKKPLQAMKEFLNTKFKEKFYGQSGEPLIV